MSVAFEAVNSQAELLSHEERAELARRLLATLEPREESVEAAWQQEVGERMKAIRQGVVPCISSEQMMAELEEELR